MELKIIALLFLILSANAINISNNSKALRLKNHSEKQQKKRLKGKSSLNKQRYKHLTNRLKRSSRSTMKFKIDSIIVILGHSLAYILTIFNKRYLEEIKKQKVAIQKLYNEMLEYSISRQVELCNYVKFTYFIINEEITLAQIQLAILSILNQELFTKYHQVIQEKLSIAREIINNDQQILCDITFDFIGERQLFQNKIIMDKNLKKLEEKENKSFFSMIQTFTTNFFDTYLEEAEETETFNNDVKTFESFMKNGNKIYEKYKSLTPDEKLLVKKSGIQAVKGFAVASAFGYEIYSKYPEAFEFVGDIYGRVKGLPAALSKVATQIKTTYHECQKLYEIFQEDLTKDEFGNQLSPEEMDKKLIENALKKLIAVAGIIKSLILLAVSVISLVKKTDEALHPKEDTPSPQPKKKKFTPPTLEETLIIADDWIIAEIELLIVKNYEIDKVQPVKKEEMLNEKVSTVKEARKLFMKTILQLIVGALYFQVKEFIKEKVKSFLKDHVPFLNIILVSIKVARVLNEVLKNKKKLLKMKENKFHQNLVASYKKNIESVADFIFCYKNKEMAEITQGIFDILDLIKIEIEEKQAEIESLSQNQEFKTIIKDILVNEHNFANKYFTKASLKTFGFDDTEIESFVKRISFHRKFSPITDFAPYIPTESFQDDYEKIYHNYGFFKQDSSKEFYCKWCSQKTGIVQITAEIFIFNDQLEKLVDDTKAYFNDKVQRELASLGSKQPFETYGVFTSMVFKNENSQIMVKILFIAYSELYDENEKLNNYVYGVSFYPRNDDFKYNHLALSKIIPGDDQSINETMQKFSQLTFVPIIRKFKSRDSNNYELIQKNYPPLENDQPIDFAQEVCASDKIFYYGMHLSQKNDYPKSVTYQSGMPLGAITLEFTLLSYINNKSTDANFLQKKNRVLTFFGLNDKTEAELQNININANDFEIDWIFNSQDDRRKERLEFFENDNYLQIEVPFSVDQPQSQNCVVKQSILLFKKYLETAENPLEMTPTSLTAERKNVFCGMQKDCAKLFPHNEVSKNIPYFAVIETKLEGGANSGISDLKKKYFIKKRDNTLPFLKSLEYSFTLNDLKSIFDGEGNSNSVFCTHHQLAQTFDLKKKWTDLPLLNMGIATFIDRIKGSKIQKRLKLGLIPDTFLWSFFFLPTKFEDDFNDFQLETYKYYDPTDTNIDTSTTGEFFRLKEIFSDKGGLLHFKLSKLYFIEAIFGDDLDKNVDAGLFQQEKLVEKVEKGLKKQAKKEEKQKKATPAKEEDEEDYEVNDDTADGEDASVDFAQSSDDVAQRYQLFPQFYSFISEANIIPYSPLMENGERFSSLDFYMRRPTKRRTKGVLGLGRRIKLTRISFRIWVKLEFEEHETLNFCEESQNQRKKSVLKKKNE